LGQFASLSVYGITTYLRGKYTACCKIKSTKTITRSISAIGPGSAGWVGKIKETNYFQVPILYNGNVDPKVACECQLGGNGITVYSAHKGPCCSCDLYFMYHDMGELSWVQSIPILRGSPHGRLVGVCSNGRVWTAQIHGKGGHNVDFKDSAKDKEYDLVRTYVGNWDRWEKKYIGQASCKNADDLKREIEQNPTQPYSEYWNNCWDYANRWGCKLKYSRK